jgi:prepilin-type N-terminal cleavage/methylation domain-containing protein
MIKKKQKGFSIIEVLITLIILGGALTALAKFQVYSLRTIGLTKQTTEAVMVGQQKLDLLRGFTSLTNYTAIATGEDTVTGNNATYTRSWTVSTNTTPAFKSIEMKVTWTDSDGTSNSVYINGVIPGMDPGDAAQLHG